MAINVYAGLQGSGKTYEVVSSVIVPALAKGRRVVTNVEGLQLDKIRDHIRASDPESPVGQIITITNEDIGKPGFWATDDTDSAFIHGGDLVCIDEAWRFFGTGCKLSPDMMVFFREHRHFTDKDTGQTCDIALMLQSVSDLHRNVKSVVEASFKTHKLKSVGMPSRYRLDMFEGADQRATRRVNTWQKKYSADIFGLYSSYTSGTGQETAIDARQNVLRDPKVWGTMLLSLVVIVAALYAMRHLYSKYRGEAPPAAASAPAAGATPGAPASPVVRIPAPSPAGNWRHVGYIGPLSRQQDVALSPGGPMLLSTGCTGIRSNRECSHEGERITTYSGPSGNPAASESRSPIGRPPK